MAAWIVDVGPDGAVHGREGIGGPWLSRGVNEGIHGGGRGHGRGEGGGRGGRGG